MEKKLLKKVTIEYFEDVCGLTSNTPETIRRINVKTTTENFSVNSTRGNPLVSYTSEIL
mgnify:FL=1